MDKFISWDSSIFLKFLEVHKLEKIGLDYLRYNFPVLADKFTKFRKLQYLNHELSVRTLDYIYETKGSDYFEIIRNAEIWHQRFIYADDLILNIDATTLPIQKFIAGNWQFAFPDRRKSGELLLLRPAELYCDLNEAIFLMGRCDENWYHFLLDTAPRLLFFETIPKDVPILIRGDLPSTSKDFIRALTPRKVIEVDIEQSVRVSNLYVCPGRSTVFDSSPPKEMNWIKFSPLVLNLFRDKVLESFGISLIKQDESRIAFGRNSSSRNVLNWAGIHKVLSAFSFRTLPINDDFFGSQVKVFFNAKFVVAPGGAVLANLMFMKPGSKVFVLQSWWNRNFRLWSKLSQTFNLELIQITGSPTYWGLKFLRRQHSNFYISPRKLRRVLSAEI